MVSELPGGFSAHLAWLLAVHCQIGSGYLRPVLIERSRLVLVQG